MSKTKNDGERFEDQLEKLEKIVARLEDESVGLEEALGLFEGGVQVRYEIGDGNILVSVGLRQRDGYYRVLVHLHLESHVPRGAEDGVLIEGLVSQDDSRALHVATHSAAYYRTATTPPQLHKLGS